MTTSEFASENPVRRGRRDSEMAIRMAQDQEIEPRIDDEEGEQVLVQDGFEPGLDPGDEVAAQYSEMVPNPVSNHDRWFKLSYTSTVRDQESGEEAFTRVGSRLTTDFDNWVAHRDGVAIDKENARRRANRPGRATQ